MKFDYKTFPILQMLDRRSLLVDSLRFYSEDIIRCEASKTHIDAVVKTARDINRIVNDFRPAFTRTFEACRANVFYITRDKIKEIHEECSDIYKGRFNTEIDTGFDIDFAGCFLYHDEKNSPCSELILSHGDINIIILLHQQSLVSITITDSGNVVDAWLSHHFNREQHCSVANVMDLHARLYEKGLKDEIEVFGKLLEPNKFLRLPNEISRFENHTNTKITILN